MLIAKNQEVLNIHNKNSKTRLKIFAAFAAVLIFSAAVIFLTANVTSSLSRDSVTVSLNTLKDSNGELAVEVLLSDIPKTKIQAAKLVFEYDPAKISLNEVKRGVCSDTGASEEEMRLYNGFKGYGTDGNNCFDYSSPKDGVLEIVWATGLEDENFWISEDGVFAAFNFTRLKNGGGVSLNIAKTSIGYVGEKSAVKYTVNFIENIGVVYGDVDLNKKVDIADVVLLARFLAGNAQLNDRQKLNANVDGNGNINVLDLLAIIKYIFDGVEFNV